MTGEPGDGWSLQRRDPGTSPLVTPSVQSPRAISRAAALAVAAALALAACDGGPAARDDSDAAEGDAAQSTALVEADVEVPGVFQVTEEGLWDGRPSLGGVWVAHPDVADPERVVIRNQDNGQTVVGALFRRERENPGPPLQVSSDAAEALSMLAGAPAKLSVTALRREEAPAPAEAAPEAAAAALPDAAPAGAVAEATAAILGGAAPTAAPAAASALERPFIQLGIFSVEANAQGLAQEMTAAGLPARVAASTTQGQDVWRVLVGPAATEAERDALQARVEAQGFADAYAVTD